MGLASTEYGQRKLRHEGKKPPPVSVAKEFKHADKGRNIAALAKHVRRK